MAVDALRMLPRCRARNLAEWKRCEKFAFGDSKSVKIGIIWSENLTREHFEIWRVKTGVKTAVKNQ